MFLIICLFCVAAEGRFFVEIRLLNRDVSVRIEGSDDYGNMLGTLLHPKGDISLLLLSNGFAKVNNATVGLTEQPNKLRQAMKEAQTNKLRRWKVNIYIIYIYIFIQ